MIELTRKDFLKSMAVGLMGASLPVVLWNKSWAESGREDSRPRFFQDPKDFETLEAFIDRLIPPDTNPDGSPSPGARMAGVADYIDFPLGAMASESSFIFAGAPFSDRNPLDGNDPASSVTDANGKFHNVANLYAADGSVFPTSGPMNPSLTIMALGYRIGTLAARTI